MTMTHGPAIPPAGDDAEHVTPEVVPPGVFPPPTPPPSGALTAPTRPAPGPARPLTGRRVGVAVAVWLVVTLVAVGLVAYGVGPMLQQRDQRGLLRDYRTEIRQSANEQVSLVLDEAPSRAPDPGDPVAILDAGALHVEQVVVEGVGPQQTRRGPGHVPGTAAPGQPGNSAVVARHTSFGATFTDLAGLEPGDLILVTTTQGQTVYETTEVRRDVRLRGEDDGSGPPPTWEETTTTTAAKASAAAPASSSTTTTSTTAESEDDALLPGGALTADDLYGPSPDDRLTLVTSASRLPWATDRATVVVALLHGDPFEPTPQNGRNAGDDGRSNDGGAAAPLALALVAYALAAGSAVVLYRRARPRSAYLVTAPPLLAATVLTAEAVARMLPAWS